MILLLILSITYCLYHTNEVKINKSVTKQESINNESIKKSGELETSKFLVDNKLESIEKEKQNLEKKLSSLKDAENVLKELQVKDDSCGCDRDDGLVPLNSTASLLDKFSEENVDTIIEGFATGVCDENSLYNLSDNITKLQNNLTIIKDVLDDIKDFDVTEEYTLDANAVEDIKQEVSSALNAFGIVNDELNTITGCIDAKDARIEQLQDQVSFVQGL